MLRKVPYVSIAQCKNFAIIDNIKLDFKRA